MDGSYLSLWSLRSVITRCWFVDCCVALCLVEGCFVLVFVGCCFVVLDVLWLFGVDWAFVCGLGLCGLFDCFGVM